MSRVEYFERSKRDVAGSGRSEWVWLKGSCYLQYDGDTIAAVTQRANGTFDAVVYGKLVNNRITSEIEKTEGCLSLEVAKEMVAQVLEYRERVKPIIRALTEDDQGFQDDGEEG